MMDEQINLCLKMGDRSRKRVVLNGRFGKKKHEENPHCGR